MDIAPGATAEVSGTVDADRTAHAMGNRGVRVFATPVGMTVRARATPLETDGKRYLFSVEAWDEKDKIAEGR